MKNYYIILENGKEFSVDSVEMDHVESYTGMFIQLKDTLGNIVGVVREESLAAWFEVE